MRSHRMAAFVVHTTVAITPLIGSITDIQANPIVNSVHHIVESTHLGISLAIFSITPLVH